MVILLHSSKTMRDASGERIQLRRPMLVDRAQQLDDYLKTLTVSQLAEVMDISPRLAEKTHALVAAWNTEPHNQSPAIDSFIGDIYSGLHANDLSSDERDTLDQVLYILSGLYGVIRPYDGICPYRLEMGYKLPDPAFANLYAYWGDAVAACLPGHGPVINLAAAEYAQTVTRYIDPARIFTPRFLTIHPKTGEPAFVVVHAKIARGAYARWIVTQRIQASSDLVHFDDLGYQFSRELSTPDSPAFVCKTFGGKGLSIRLQS